MDGLQNKLEGSPYTPQYNTLIGATHTRPTQEIGAPTLIWHLAVWPKSTIDPENVRFGNGDKTAFQLDEDEERLSKPNVKVFSDYDQAISNQNLRRRTIFGPNCNSQNEKDLVSGTLNSFLYKLQKAGRYANGKIAQFRLDSPVDSDRNTNSGEIDYLDEKVRYKFAYPENIEFTLWWNYDPSKLQNSLLKRDLLPGFDALRIRVQIEAQPDYFTITFLADIGKCWHSGSVYSSENAPGVGRQRVFKAVEKIKDICQARLTNGEIESSLIPLDKKRPIQNIPLSQLEAILKDDYEKEKSNTKEVTDASDLLQETEFLYSKFWIDFCEDFRFTVQDIVGSHGHVFANFRGVVLSTQGLAFEPAAPQNIVSPGKNHFPKFGDDAEDRKDGTEERASREANAVLKAFWPMIRQIKSYADSRQYVACGVMNWRALYVTALGSKRDYYKGDESFGREYEDPYGSLPELQNEQDENFAKDPQIGPRGEEPVRYLILTKHDPHRGQLGRIVDRINAMGTTRLFALRNLSSVRAAGDHIRLRAQHLNEVSDRWIRKRKKLRDKHKFDENNDKLNKHLADLNKYAEDELLEIGSALNSIGNKAVGGLAYRVNRSNLYAQRFDDLRKDLLISNIESWTSYNQFALRNIRPLFSFIEQTGQRLAGLRQRLAIVMENIQTAAIVSQTEETRHNTRELEKLQSSATNLGLLGALALLIGSVQPLETLIKEWSDECIKPGEVNKQLFCRTYTEIFGVDEAGKINAFWVLFIFTAIILSIIAVSLSVKRSGWRKTFRAIAVFLSFSVILSHIVIETHSSYAVITDLAKLISQWLLLPAIISVLLWLSSSIIKRVGKFLKKRKRLKI